MLNLTYHTDPGHGWVEVPKNLVLDLNIEEKITEYSYYSYSTETYFLEEDQDASTLIKALKDHKIEYAFTEVYHNSAPCRRLNNVNPKLIKGFKVIK